MKKWVPDTSVLINGKLTNLVETDKVEGEIIIPVTVIDELQAQASRGRDTGFQGLEELKRVRVLGESGKKIKLIYTGRRPTMEEIMMAKKGRLDAMIRDVAKENGATLITADYVQALVAEAEGVSVMYMQNVRATNPIKLEDFFDDQTSSVHLKADVLPMAKKGKPGEVTLVKIRDTPTTEEEIEALIKEILDRVRHEKNAFIEMGSAGAMVIQFDKYRIAIARRPFSDGLELTAVRPMTKLVLSDYKLSDKLMERLKQKAEGVVICGPPGSGKSTFAASVAEFYLSLGKIVKTIENPRDLQVPPEITQYGPLDGSMEKTADILLLVRPDYTVYDEVRKTKDFELFADMRMAGVGMVGVVHSSEAIDSIQRFIGRIEMGMVTSVLDTIIFLKDGQVRKVYELEMLVRVPTGMTEADLSRPLIEVRDFETGKCEYEIYTYGEENVVLPVSDTNKEQPVQKLAKERILQEIRKFDPGADAEVVSDNKVIVRVDNEMIPHMIGKEGKTVMELEKRLGISIDIEPLAKSLGKPVSHTISESGAYVNIGFDSKMSGKSVTVHVDDEFLFSATVGSKDVIKVSKESDIGAALMRAVINRKKIKCYA
ncbi:MAG: Flp pilus assembly complex ATPase component TadA [Candidatus Aenigmarchaeota archaeon]|nr:Flp pilus assembly complex ATPase component TadA [Candidatus Aenigmarchaeota archaeon]